MDAGGLLVSVVALIEIVDHLQQTYQADPTILASIESQLKTLEACLERIQEWQHYTDPQSEAQVLTGLRESTKTIADCVRRLKQDLESRTAQTATAASLLIRSRSEGWIKKPTDDEIRLKIHIVDLRQCVSLAQFTLSVCQLPLGPLADKETRELSMGAKALQRAHVSNGMQRQNLIQEQLHEEGQERTADFSIFTTSVLDAEVSMSELSPHDSPISQTPHEHAYAPRTNLPSREHDDGELFLPENENELYSPASPSRPPPPLPAKSEWRQSGPVLPPKLRTQPRPDPGSLRKQLSRKPVSGTISRMSSVYAESVLSDATLTIDSPIAEKSSQTFPVRRDSPLQSRNMLEPGSLNTNVLLSQASRSLTSLAQNFETARIDEADESPPPYVTSRTPSFPRDIKRRDTQSSMELNAAQSNLMQIVRDNEVDLLLALLNHGVNIDDVDPETNRTAIIEATNLRRTKISQILIRSGSRLHLKDIEGNTALHFAAFNGDSNTCVLLLDAGAQLNEYNRYGETPLDLAARGGHTEAVVCLLNSWVSQNGHATTLLKGFLEATKSGNASTAQAFIERGVQPKKLKESWKPVVYAAQSGSIPMMDLMLSEKCNMSKRDPDGWAAIHYAAQAGHTAMVEKLLSWKVSWSTQTSKLGETALHIAILAGQLSTALALIYHKNAAITTKDNDNHQALHHAVRNGDVQLTTLLLNKGAKLDATTNYGWKPMHIAAAYGHLPLVAEFITRGVSTEEKLEEPSNKQHKKTNEAARKGYWCEIRWPHPGARPIHLAIEFGHEDVVRTLIGSGAKITEGDSKSWRPLHYAAWNCRPQMVELLLARGADPHATTEDRNTPISLGYREHGLVASMQEKQQIYEILQAAMNAHRRSTLKKLADFKGIGHHKTKEIIERNKAWHTAELAATLYLNGQLEDGESDSFSQLAPSMSSLSKRESKDQDDIAVTPQASSSRLVKRPTD